MHTKSHTNLTLTQQTHKDIGLTNYLMNKERNEWEKSQGIRRRLLHTLTLYGYRTI